MILFVVQPLLLHFFHSSLTVLVTPGPVMLSLSRPSSATLVPASAPHLVTPARSNYAL